PRTAHAEEGRGDKPCDPGEVERPGIGSEQDQSNQAAAEDRPRTAVEVEHMAIEPRILTEVSRLADLGPRRINAKGQQREKQIDDPKAKILGTASGEDRAARGRDWRV